MGVGHLCFSYGHENDSVWNSYAGIEKLPVKTRHFPPHVSRGLRRKGAPHERTACQLGGALRRHLCQAMARDESLAGRKIPPGSALYARSGPEMASQARAKRAASLTAHPEALSHGSCAWARPNKDPPEGERLWKIRQPNGWWGSFRCSACISKIG